MPGPRDNHAWVPAGASGPHCGPATVPDALGAWDPRQAWSGESWRGRRIQQRLQVTALSQGRQRRHSCTASRPEWACCLARGSYASGRQPLPKVTELVVYSSLSGLSPRGQAFLARTGQVWRWRPLPILPAKLALAPRPWEEDGLTPALLPSHAGYFSLLLYPADAFSFQMLCPGRPCLGWPPPGQGHD